MNTIMTTRVLRHASSCLLTLLFVLTVSATAQEAITFSFEPPPGAPEVQSVTVPGSFNGWNTGAAPMERQMDGSWRVTLELEPGDHQYKFFINGVWPQDMCGSDTWGDSERNQWIDPNADRCVDDGHGGRNALRSVGLAAPDDTTSHGFHHTPQDPAYVSRAAERLSVRFMVNTDTITGATLEADGTRYPMHYQLSHRNRDMWRGTLPSGTTAYSIEIETPSGAESFGPFETPDDLFTEVPWVGDMIGYQIFPERFWNGDPSNDHWTLETDSYNFKDPEHWNWPSPPVLTEGWEGPVLDLHCCHQYFGGDLQGVRDRLDELEALGVTLLYFTPLFTSGSAHGYDTSNYLEVAPNFGDEELLLELLKEAQSRGMRVMWDFVPNHVGVGHWAFQEALLEGEGSPYWDWFFFHVPAAEVEVGRPDNDHYDSWWGLGNLPVLNTTNPEVLEHLLEITQYWTKFGFDGIRVDVPGDIRNRSEFFPAFRDAAKSVNPEVYLVGEIWQRNPSWLQGDEFDSLMNYAISQGVIEPFARGLLRGPQALTQMAELYATYPEASIGMQFNIISSHDRPRLLTLMGGGRLGETPSDESLARQRLASAMLYALPGMPVTFQGDECALLGRGDGPQEENRYPVQWDECNEQMRAHYQELAQLKAMYPALSSPVWRGYHGQGNLLAFTRGEPGDDELYIVFNNSSREAKTVELPRGTYQDVQTGEMFEEGIIEVPSLGWRFLTRFLEH